jgi:hypothetical protein
MTNVGFVVFFDDNILATIFFLSKSNGNFLA